MHCTSMLLRPSTLSVSLRRWIYMTARIAHTQLPSLCPYCHGSHKANSKSGVRQVASCWTWQARRSVGGKQPRVALQVKARKRLPHYVPKAAQGELTWSLLLLNRYISDLTTSSKEAATVQAGDCGPSRDSTIPGMSMITMLVGFRCILHSRELMQLCVFSVRQICSSESYPFSGWFERSLKALDQTFDFSLLPLRRCKRLPRHTCAACSKTQISVPFTPSGWPFSPRTCSLLGVCIRSGARKCESVCYVEIRRARIGCNYVYEREGFLVVPVP